MPVRLIVFVLAAASVSLAACTHSHRGAGEALNPSTSESPSVQVSTSTADTTTSTTTASTTTAISSSANLGPSECTNNQLQVSSSARYAALGNEGMTVLFRNHSTTACVLTGYLGVAALNANDQQIAQATRTTSGYLGGCNCTTPAAITLAPGSTASSLIEGNIAGGGSNCTAETGLLVTPPNTTDSTQLDVTLAICDFQQKFQSGQSATLEVEGPIPPLPSAS